MAHMANLQRSRGRRALTAADFYKSRPKKTTALPDMDRDTALVARTEWASWVKRKGGVIVNPNG